MSKEPGGGVMDEIKRSAAKLVSYFAFAHWLWDKKEKGLSGLSAGDYTPKAAPAPRMNTQVKTKTATPLVVDNTAAKPLIESLTEKAAVPLAQVLPTAAARPLEQDLNKKASGSRL